MISVGCTCNIEGSPCPNCRQKTDYDQRKSIEQKSKFQRGKEISSEPSIEWDEEDAIPPVGCECELTLGAKMTHRAKITYVGDGVFCYVDMESGNEYTGNLLDAIFTPRKSKASRDRDELIGIISNAYETFESRADTIIANGWQK